MSNKAIKMAISLPKEEFLMIEKLRRKLDLSRSALIDEAIRFWLAKRSEREQILQYEQGYRKRPEKVQDLRALEKAQLEAIAHEEEWS